MSRDVVIHAGTFRTGTTSIQRALAHERRGVLQRNGFAYPPGMVLDHNHLDLVFASMRPDRLDRFAPFADWLLAQTYHPIKRCQDPRWAEIVHDAYASMTGEALLLSNEGLAWLRYEDEIESLIDLFPDARMSMVYFTRRADAFLESYKWATKLMGRREVEHPDSVFYVAPDSWLVDHQPRAELWRRMLGPDSVTTLGYEDACRRYGSTVTAFLDAVGIEPSEFDDLDGYRLNARPPT